MQIVQLPDNTTIADTIATVFSRPAYATEQPSVGDMILRWIISALDSVMMLMAGNPVARGIVRWGLIIAAGLIVARIAYAVVLHLRHDAFRGGRAGARGTAYDPWAAAHQFAAQGRYTDAAHALYGGLILTMARKGRVTVHESKTAGDYIRELRRSEMRGETQVAAVPPGMPTQSQVRLANQFGEFARFYETIVYRLGSCSAEEYARLQTLAAPLIARQA